MGTNFVGDTWTIMKGGTGAGASPLFFPSDILKSMVFIDEEKKMPEKPKIPTLHHKNDLDSQCWYGPEQLSNGENDIVGWLRTRDDKSIVFQLGGDEDSPNSRGKIIVLKPGTLPTKRRKKSILPAKNHLPVKELSELANLD